MLLVAFQLMACGHWFSSWNNCGIYVHNNLTFNIRCFPWSVSIYGIHFFSKTDESHVYFKASNLHMWRRQWHSTPVLLPGKSHGWRSLEGYSPWGHWGSDTTERLHFHFSLSCIGEGNGNPLQCSCLENPRDGGARLAAVYGVAQSRTWLKWLSSSSNLHMHPIRDGSVWRIASLECCSVT